MESYLELEESILEELDIDNSSVFALENELKEHPKKAAKYQKLFAQSISEVNRLKLKVKIVVAEIMDDIVGKAKESGNPIPMSYRTEVRKVKVPLDPRFVEATEELNEALSNKQYLEGLVFAFANRSTRLREMVRLTETSLKSGGDFGLTVPKQAKMGRVTDRLNKASKNLDYS